MGRFSDDAIKAALCGSQAMRRYPFPGHAKTQVAVKLLTDAQLDGARLRAVETVKARKAEVLIDPDFLDRCIHREIIAAAFYDADESSKDVWFFADQDEVAQLDNHTVRALYELYMTHAQSMDPYAYCPPEEVEALSEQLGKSENSVGILNLYDAVTLRSLLLSTSLKLRETQQQLS